MSPPRREVESKIKMKPFKVQLRLEHRSQPLGRNPIIFFLQTKWIALCVASKNIFEADDIRLIEYIHIETWKFCNAELSRKTKVDKKHCQVEVHKEYFWTSFSNHRENS